LANNFGLLHWAGVQQWWPLILIGVGVWSIAHQRPGDRHPSKGSDEKP
jgi:hypothetical protein